MINIPWLYFCTAIFNILSINYISSIITKKFITITITKIVRADLLWSRGCCTCPKGTLTLRRQWRSYPIWRRFLARFQGVLLRVMWSTTNEVRAHGVQRKTVGGIILGRTPTMVPICFVASAWLRTVLITTSVLVRGSTIEMKAPS